MKRAKNLSSTLLHVALFVVLSHAVFPAAADSSSLTVPDDVPTIQAALDSIYAGAPVETVEVRVGVPPERVVVRGPVALIGLPEFAKESGDPLPPILPTLADLTVISGNDFIMRSMRVRGLLTIWEAVLTNTFYNCQMDSGVVSPGSEPKDVQFIGCTLAGRLAGEYGLQTVGFDLNGSVEFDSCVVRGQINCRATPGGTVAIRNSLITGSDYFGIISFHGDMDCWISGNTVRGFANGIAALNVDRATIVDNIVEDCTATGIDIQAGYGGADVTRNQVQGSSIGISCLSDERSVVKDNVVLHSINHGMRLILNGGLVQGNVVGLGDGDGLFIERDGYNDPAEVLNNTSFLNSGSGFVIDDYPDHSGRVTHNIGYGNRGYGLLSVGEADPLLSCNDWFANDSSNVGGMDSAPDDLSLAPGFCDATHGDVHLAANSPLFNAQRCGLIGALWVGCDLASSPTPASGVRFAATVVPNPLRGAGTLNLTLTRPGRVRMEILDVQGRGVAMPLDATLDVGLHPIALGARHLRPGVYLYRVQAPEGVVKGRFVVVE